MIGAIVNPLIGVIIALLPLYTKLASEDVSRISKDNLLLILMGLICYLLPNKKRDAPKLIKLGLIYGLICLTVNQITPISIIVIMQMIYVSFGMIFFVMFYERHDQKDINTILNGMSIGCLVQCLFLISSYFDFNFYFWIIKQFNSGIIWEHLDSDRNGTLGNSNLFASYVSLTFFSLFRGKWKYLIPIPLFSLFLAGSAMGYITLIAGTLYFVNLKFNLIKKYIVYLSSLSLMAAAFFHGVWGMDTKRFEIWKVIFNRVDLGHFLVGKGPGWLALQGIKNSSNFILLQEHNEFIAAFNIFGTVGILFLIPWFIKFLKSKDINPIFSSIVFASFINAYGHFNLHQSTTAIIILVSAAICLAEGEKNVLNLER
ncbi:MAG: hypothetical protein AB7I27_00380 [Bacteriovoracaceae bacterium]